MTERCESCGCRARHTPDTSTPELTYCQRCTAGCWTGKRDEPTERVVLGTCDFGYGWAGTQLRQWIRRGLL